MKQINQNSIDLIVTSPPYNKWKNRRTQKKKEQYWERTNIIYDKYEDKKTDEEYYEFQIIAINEMLRILKETGTIAYNHKDDIYNFVSTSPLKWIWKSNAIVRQRITWDRRGMQSFNNVRFYRNEEDIYILGKNAKGFKWNKEFAKYMSIWSINPERNINHPAPFPEEIPKRCIESFTNVDDVILDPFMGSGTTLVSAKKLKRKAIGIEISREYCEIAIERIENIKNYNDLFDFKEKEVNI